MAEVVKSGRTAQVWAIVLKCPCCDCVARYKQGDVEPGSEAKVRCPECGRSIAKSLWACDACGGLGYTVATVEGYGGDPIVTQRTCACQNLGGRPE